MLLVGLVIAPVNVAIGGWLPRLADPAQMGRFSAWNDPLLMLGQSAALGAIALLFPSTVGLATIYAALSALVFLAFAFYAFTLPGCNGGRRASEGKGRDSTRITSNAAA